MANEIKPEVIEHPDGAVSNKYTIGNICVMETVKNDDDGEHRYTSVTYADTDLFIFVEEQSSAPDTIPHLINIETRGINHKSEPVFETSATMAVTPEGTIATIKLEDERFGFDGVGKVIGKLNTTNGGGAYVDIEYNDEGQEDCGKVLKVEGYKVTDEALSVFDITRDGDTTIKETKVGDKVVQRLTQKVDPDGVCLPYVKEEIFDDEYIVNNVSVKIVEPLKMEFEDGSQRQVGQLVTSMFKEPITEIEGILSNDFKLGEGESIIGVIIEHSEVIEEDEDGNEVGASIYREEFYLVEKEDKTIEQVSVLREKEFDIPEISQEEADEMNRETFTQLSAVE